MSGFCKLKIFDTVRGTLEIPVRDDEEAELIAAVFHELEPTGRQTTRYEFVRQWGIGPEVSPLREMRGVRIDGVVPRGRREHPPRVSGRTDSEAVSPKAKEQVKVCLMCGHKEIQPAWYWEKFKYDPLHAGCGGVLKSEVGELRRKVS